MGQHSFGESRLNGNPSLRTSLLFDDSSEIDSSVSLFCHADILSAFAIAVKHPISMDENAFGVWLRRQLERRDWLQADLVHRGKFSRSAVSDWVNGKRIPDPASCDLIADALGLDRDLVLSIAGHRPVAEDDSPLVREFIAKVRRIDWAVGDRALFFDRIVNGWLDDDRKMREGK